MILAIHGILCTGMLMLLRKNRVNQRVRLFVAAGAVLVFGIFLRSELEPVRGLVQVFQSLVMGRHEVQETLLVFFAFTLMALVGVKLICGWGCPVGALQELLYNIPVFSGIKKKRVLFCVSNSVRIILFIVFLVFLFGWIPSLREA